MRILVVGGTRYFGVKGIPMKVDNSKEVITFIQSCEAGDFLSWIANSKLKGPINACSSGVSFFRAEELDQ